MFVYLSEVTDAHGPPHLVSRRVTGSPAALPDWIGPAERPQFYANEVSATGALGTVVAFEIGTFHRGTQLTEPRGARFTLHVNFFGFSPPGHPYWSERTLHAMTERHPGLDTSPWSPPTHPRARMTAPPPTSTRLAEQRFSCAL